MYFDPLFGPLMSCLAAQEKSPISAHYDPTLNQSFVAQMFLERPHEMWFAIILL